MVAYTHTFIQPYECVSCRLKTLPYQDVLLFFNSLLLFLFAITPRSVRYDFIYSLNKNTNESEKNAVQNESK